MTRILSTGNQIAFDDNCLGDIMEWRANWPWRRGKSSFGPRSRHTRPVVGTHEQQPVSHVGMGCGLIPKVIINDLWYYGPPPPYPIPGGNAPAPAISTMASG